MSLSLSVSVPVSMCDTCSILATTLRSKAVTTLFSCVTPKYTCVSVSVPVSVSMSVSV